MCAFPPPKTAGILTLGWFKQRQLTKDEELVQYLPVTSEEYGKIESQKGKEKSSHDNRRWPEPEVTGVTQPLLEVADLNCFCVFTLLTSSDD